MSRHNRRRHRGGHRNSVTYSQHAEEEHFTVGSNATLTWGEPSTHLRAPSRRDDISARHWHNRYIAWKAHEKRRQEERRRWEMEQIRIFGGDENDKDDDGLCTKMLDYFTALDYIDP